MSKIKKVVVIYPGRFQPFSKHHAATFVWIKNNFPGADCYIGTTNVTNETSPFNFNEKKAIVSAYGFASAIKKITNPYKADEILSKYDKNTTAVVFVVGAKDADRLERGFLLPYPKNEATIQPFKKHGYIIIAPHIKLNVPGYGEMSGTTVRTALGDTSKTRKQKKKLFNDIFGWYSDKLANIIFDKLESLNEDKIPGGLAANKSISDIAKHHNANLDDIKSQIEKGIKIEMEHTTDAQIAREIAKDHIWEDPEYYTKLADIEKHEQYINEDDSGKHKLFSAHWWKDSLKESFIDHAKDELNRAGLFDKDSDYEGMIGKAVYELVNVFSKQGHSGFSAQWVRELFNKLSKYETLTPLTNNSDEWTDVAEISGGDDPETLWQNKRNPAVFSKDGGKTMYHVDGKTIKNGIVEGIKLFLTKNKLLLSEMKLPKDNWVTFNLNSVSDDDMKRIWNMYSSTYSKAGMDFSANDYKELRSKYKAIAVEDVDGDSIPDAFIIHKTTDFGNKIALLGTNDKKEAKRALIKKLFELVRTRGWYIEASLKMEELLSKSNVPVVKDQGFLEYMFGKKDIKFLDNGYYERKLSKTDTRIVKRVYGKPIMTNKLNEGGAGGHILYTFELPTVKTGKDLINIHKKSIDSLSKSPASVKVDGINVSIKLVDKNGTKQFALDRASNREQDRSGVTKNDLDNRFPKGHGMIPVASKVLSAFNAALPKSKSVLSRLGLWDDPKLVLNIEYVSGKTNVTEFKGNFVAIHGVLKDISTDTSRKFKEISLSSKLLTELASILKPIFNKSPYNLDVYYDMKTKVTKEVTLDSLSKPTTIYLTKNKKITKKLSEWLSKIIIPSMSESIKWNGKKEPVMKRQIFVDILNGAPVSEFISSEADLKTVIAAFITWKATLDMGEDILSGLSSDLGEMIEQEGIIIRDSAIYSGPYKIIGKFILRAMSSPYKKKSSVNEGGNVFKSKSGEHETIRIKRDDVIPTVKWLESITKLPLINNIAGSAGKKIDSGDIDLIVDIKKHTKESLISNLNSWANKNSLNAKDYVRKSGDSVHFKAPINNDAKNGFVQVDFMFGDPIMMLWTMAGSPEESKYKGVHRHVLMSSIASFNGLKWSWKDGLISRTTNKILTKDPDEIAEILLGPNHTKKDLDSVESILDSIKDNPNRDKMLQQAKDTLKDVYGIDLTY